MGGQVIANGELLVCARKRQAFLDAWGDGFVDDHRHSWRCVARYFGSASVRSTPAGDITVSIDCWSDLDYLAAALVDRLSPHVASGLLHFAYEFDESDAWSVKIADGLSTEE